MTSEVKILLGIGLATVALTLGAVFLLSKPSSGPSSLPVNKDVLGALVRGDSIKIASDSAKVTIVEFSDYQCPACKSANPTIKQILNDYPGKVNFIYRHFPLSQHKNAIPASLAAEAAGQQGKYWEMHDRIFDGQDTWKESSQAQDIFTGFAKDLGLDVEKFNLDKSDNKFRDKINRDYQDGLTLGVNSTPTFFINGQKFPGALSYADFKTRIDAELSK
ncbi:MAG: hypothetical protein A2835_02380 [Candidatus Niyogibacteria bacterium RIFCSPHIGHO2_01_FULL_45_28]|uniref:Thioredoxin domain-containing protein n=2 Tax=Candidatus Daviesiibacteriota TaxID=1752718 RepID=A0A1F5K5P1_9BACT|nr:MAG: hypothetical protein UV41_C0011G0026 [Candidatus Daviesbacteria bacterium GW2011_GWA2_42_7]OGE36134.1 MAG: hypothetical protein A3E45_02635 [Candidatus Daviesbacteria bacterium RIFCSPHIGHO2_12_FULL_43_11]OGE63341.1 MAG: hypothetical protein A3A14_01105 [Candidatus Daviesbacteria bacterium RIFCSPLOWO2_01_FULL_43_38]OGZ29107.1 MAG: hypothetical protein A2835_02380 [Candidatus Niyogibacteria bacterium RIFCSPHIGHO2_01_FULL_45_28]